MIVEPIPAHCTAEAKSAKTMIERGERSSTSSRNALLDDSTYGTAPMLARMMEVQDIEPHLSVLDKTKQKNDSFSSNEFPLE